jgi:hypothetical protein
MICLEAIIKELYTEMMLSKLINNKIKSKNVGHNNGQIPCSYFRTKLILYKSPIRNKLWNLETQE